MNIRKRAAAPYLALGLVGVALFAAAIVAGKVAFGANGSGDNTYMGAVILSPIDMPAATLTDQDGKPFDLKASTAGYVTLVYVGYTHCPDVCPTHLSNMAQAIKQLPGAIAGKVKVVFVTADPDRDTPAVLKQYLGSFDPKFIGLTGTPAQLEAFEGDLGVPVSAKEDLGGGNYSVTHAAFVVAFTKDQVGHTVYPAGMGIREWLNDLPLLVKYGFKPG